MKIINKIRKAIAERYCKNTGHIMTTTHFLECLPAILGLKGKYLCIKDDRLWIWDETDMQIRKPICFHDYLDVELNDIEEKNK